MSRRKKRLMAQIGPFVDEYGRRKRPGKSEPNDRQYDREIEKLVKRMDPRELDSLLRDGDDET